jgi:hypothetical protein
LFVKAIMSIRISLMVLWMILFAPVLRAQERLDSLPLSTRGLDTKQYTAVVLGRYETPDYRREVIRVQWRPGDPIELYVVLPHAVVRPPAVLYLYDYRYDAERFRTDFWCKRMTAGGAAAVGFTSALSPERFHNRPMKEWFVSELQESLASSVHDVQMILNYLASRGDLDMNRIGMFGQGSGGAIAILSASVDQRIRVVDVLNPWGDWPDWLRTSPQIPDGERPDYVTPEFLKRVAGMDPASTIPGLHLQALRVQQVLDDLVTPSVARDAIAAVVKSPALLARSEDTRKYTASLPAGGVSQWIREQLSVPRAAQIDAPQNEPRTVR